MGTNLDAVRIREAQRSDGLQGAERIGEVEPEALRIARGLEESGAPTPGTKPSPPGALQRLLQSGTRAVVGVGLALMVGLGGMGCATQGKAQQSIDPVQCQRNTAWAASIGSQIGRQIDPQRGGVLGGALAALLERAVGCSTASQMTSSPQIKQLNHDIEEALALDSAKFGSGATLTDPMKQILDDVVGELADRYPNARILVVAHADVAGNVALMNRGLSRERANAVVAYLRDAGVKQAIDTQAAGDTEGKNRLELVVVEQPTSASQADNPFGIPGLRIHFGNGGISGNGQGNVGGHGTPNVNFPGGANQNGVGNGPQRQSPGPGTSGWNGH